MPDEIDPLAAWRIAEDDFPRAGTLAEKLRFMAGYAVLAPSSHNAQPWRFEVHDKGVRLFADRSRSLPASDPHDRELAIGVGAALFNLQMALRHFGYTDIVTIRPDPDDADLLARVEVGDSPRVGGEERLDFAAIVERRTSRSRYDDRPVPEGVLSACLESAHEHGARLHVVREQAERDALAALVSEADRVQAGDRDFREELAKWLHPNRTARGDGMPGFAHGLGDLASLAMPLVVRTFDWGQRRAAADRRIALGSPVLAVIETDADDPASWVRTGQALESVLLRSTADGVSSSYLNQPVEVPALRTRLAESLGVDGFPQIVLRMGFGPPAHRTPRRPVADVLID